MSCRATFSNKTAGLDIDTWSGAAKDQNGNPQLICSIANGTEADHFVEVKNLKTYDRDVTARGIISSTINRAKFDGPFIINEREWKETKHLNHSPPADVITFRDTSIVKKSSGQEDIRTEIEYEDSWNIGNIKRADDTSNPIVFRIDLI